MGFLVAVVIGGLAGYIASIIVGKNGSIGVIGNIIVGFFGGVIANAIFGDVHLSHPTFGSFLLTILGALVLLLVVNFFTRRKSN